MQTEIKKEIPELELLNRWKSPDNYIGAEWPDYFVFLGQHRDSDALTRSNFECGLVWLGGESETVRVIRERHWAVGWVEWIAIHESAAAKLKTAENILRRLEAYPVLDEEHFSELEWREAEQFWGTLSIRERVDLCREAGISIFAARHGYIPRDDSGYIFESLRG